MTQPQKPGAAQRADPKTTLTALKWTTGLSAVALTLAGWGLLARAETVSAAGAGSLTRAAPAVAHTGILGGGKAAALGGPAPARAMAGTRWLRRLARLPKRLQARRPAAHRGAAATVRPTAAPTAVPTDVPTDVPTAAPTPAPTDTPAVKFKLDVVQWVQNQAGDNIAVVRDNQGILWYVWGDDVPRIEQGLSPQYQPVPVNQVGRSRHS